MYQALYRKWRPQTFDEVVGQKHITETLKNQVRSGRLSHAYIFIGTRGTGKTTCARILAKAVNCEHPVNGNPCCQCAACRGIADGSVLDVVELDAASNNGVDNVRALREEAVFSPASVRKRVYIIDEVHMLSTSAFNALLKILEEPPEHLMFILATTELQKVPATILSRCQRHSFRRIDAPQLAEYLEYVARQESFDLTHDAAELIARLAEGGVRDALSLLDQCSAFKKIDTGEVYSAMGLAGNRRITEMLDCILKHDTAAALEKFTGLWMDGKDPAVFLKELSGLMRDVLIELVAPQSGMSLVTGGYDSATLGSFAARMTREELICAMETVQRYTAQLREAKNPRTVVELCLISLCDNTLGESVDELRARISRLEAQAAGLAQMPGYTATPQPDTVQGHAPAENAEEQPRRVPERVSPAAEQPSPVPAETERADAAAALRQDTEPERKPEEPAGAAPAGDADMWDAVCKAAAPLLAPDVRLVLSDKEKIRGALDQNVLRIECIPGFLYGRINKQDVLQKFGAAASKLAGREVRVMLSEFRPDSFEKRSVEELRQFKEVRFI